jgi:hypothetical protein
LRQVKSHKPLEKLGFYQVRRLEAAAWLPPAQLPHEAGAATDCAAQPAQLE